MDTRTKKILIITGTLIAIGFIVVLLVYLLVPKVPSNQRSDKTVIIDNYADYTSKISSDSFGVLGNDLYRFIKNPNMGVYHATIVDESYTYSSTSWFSKFTVKLKDSDISWKISLQTVKNGDINGDISITCESGSNACLSLSDTMNSKRALQDLLPLSSNDYIISSQTDNYDALSIIYYDQNNVGKDKALEKIKSLGFKPDDYKIEYFYGGR
jgi:hypothetical protein